MSAHSVGAYTATLLVMVHVMKGVGRAPPTLTSQANFTLMTECTPESRRYYSAYSVVVVLPKHKVHTYVEYRAVSRVFQNIDPPPPSPPSECVLPPHQRRAVRGVGDQYFGRRMT